MNTVGVECFVKEMQDIDVEQDSNPCLTNCYTIISVTCLTSNGKLHEQDQMKKNFGGMGMSDVLKVSMIAYSATKCKLRIFQNIIRVCKKITKCMCMQFKEIFLSNKTLEKLIFLDFLKKLNFLESGKRKSWIPLLNLHIFILSAMTKQECYIISSMLLSEKSLAVTIISYS